MSCETTSRRRAGRRFATAVLPCLVLSLLLAPTAWAGPKDEDGASTRDARVLISVSDAEGMPMEQFLTTAAQLLDMQLTWNKNDKQIRSSKVAGPMTIKDTQQAAFERIRGLLTTYDLVVIPLGDRDDRHYLVTDARRTTSILRLKAEFVNLDDANVDRYAEKDGLYITTTIRMKHMTDLRNARNALARLVTGQMIGNVTEVPDARAFVVTDFAPNVAAIYRLLRAMDQAPPPHSAAVSERTYRAIGLQYSTATDVARHLIQLFPSPTAVPAAPTRRPTTGHTTRHVIPLRIQAEPRTNQILITGREDEVEQVIAAIKTIDVPTSQVEIEVTVIRLAHLNASMTAGVISNLIGRSKAIWRNQPDGAYPAVEADPQTNALLVAAHGDALATIRRLIAEMDVPQGEAGKPGDGDK